MIAIVMIRCIVVDGRVDVKSRKCHICANKAVRVTNSVTCNECDATNPAT